MSLAASPGGVRVGRGVPLPSRGVRRVLTVAAWSATLGFLGVLIAALEPAYVVLLTGGLILAGLVLARPSAAIPVLLFAVPFGAALRPDTGDVDVAAGPTEALVALLALAWLARGVRLRSIAVGNGTVVAAIVVLTALMLLSIGYAASAGLAVKESLKWLELLLVLVIVVDCAADERTVTWMLAALFAAGGAEALWGVMQVATGGGPAAFQVDGALRAFGHFEQPNPFAGYLATILPLAVLMAIVARPRPRFRWFALGSTLAMLLAVAASQSRGAWLGVAAAAVCLRAAWSRRTRFWLLPLAGAAALFTILAAAGLLPASMADRLGQAVEYFGVFDVRTVELTSQNWAVVERMAHWQAGWSMFLDHPWLGVGAGNYAAAYPLYYVPPWLEPLGHAHNYYLNTLAELGVVGLVLLLAVLTTLFGQLGAALRLPTDADTVFWRAVVAGVVGALVVFCVHSLFDNLFVHSVNVQLGFMVGLGLVAAERLRQRSAARQSAC